MGGRQLSSTQVRRASISLALGFGAALSLSAALGYHDARDAAQTLARGQGALLAHTVTQAYLSSSTTDPSWLSALVRAESDAGLRGLTLEAKRRPPAGHHRRRGDRRPPPGGEAGSVGHPAPSPDPTVPRDAKANGAPPPDQHHGPAGPRARPGHPIRLANGNIRMRHPLPPLPGRNRHVAVMEFEATSANALLAGARRTLAVAIIVTLLSLVVGWLLYRTGRERERLERQLAIQRQESALGDMSSVIAHEVRNPLAALKGHAQLLAETLTGDERKHAKVQRIVQQAQRLERIVNDLLRFAKSGGIDRSVVDPVHLIENCIHDVESGRLKSGPISVDVQPAGPVRTGRFVLDFSTAPRSWSLDPAACARVVSNLLDNALQSSPEGQVVSVFCGKDRESLLISVSDHGPGIAESEREKIFEPFHTTRARGTGLGLPIARRIATLHGGSLVASTAEHPGGGACFRLLIPGE